MGKGVEQPWAILAFDHRGELSRSVFDKEIVDLMPEQLASLSEVKSIIFDGYVEAAKRGLCGVRSGVLVDEQFGAEVARRSAGRTLLAMPVEKADQDIFEFEYGKEFSRHIESFDPDYVKALVRFNADGDVLTRQTQLSRLHVLSQSLRKHQRKFIFELIVVPTDAQLESVGGDRVRFEDELRPGLVVRAMTEIISADIWVDVWKLEGVSSLGDAREIVETARAGNPSVDCLVLGAASAPDRLNQWLSVAARTDGFNGFAIGRSIWKDCIRSWLACEITREKAVATVAHRYIEYIDGYLAYEK